MKKELVINPYAPEGFYKEEIFINRNGEFVKTYMVTPSTSLNTLFNERYSLKNKNRSFEKLKDADVKKS